MIKVKICGITNHKDASTAVDYGADALGFVFFPKSPRNISPEAAKAIVSSLPPFVSTVGVFVDCNKKELEEISSFVGLSVIQLHGSESPEYCNSSKTIIKAIRIKEPSDINMIHNYKTVSTFLLDAYSPGLVGGTGNVFNWDIACQAKKSTRIILAGGLTPDNIEEAIRQVGPYGVDVSSGVESINKGKKDHNKVKLFIENAKKAF